ncbi:MAG: PEP-CTERM sorting domain-containing protein [Cyanobacteriota bacterium]
MGLAIATGLALAPFSSPAQAYTVTTSFSNWQAVLSGYVITTDPMDTVIASAQTILLDSGITSTNSGPITLPNPPYNNNSVNASGIYNNAVQGGSGVGVTASNTINWIFPSPVVAFGAFFQSASSGRLNLAADFDGMGIQTLLVNETMMASTGFLGIIGTVPFTNVTFGNATDTVDGFGIDQAAFAPVPGPLPVLGASAALGWSRRLRRRIAPRGAR